MCIKIPAAVLALLWMFHHSYAQPPLHEREILINGYELFESGRYRAAQEELEKAAARVSPDSREEAVRIDYMLTVCAARLGQRNSMEMLRAFLDKHPNSIYSNDIRFEIANTYYMDGNYTRARQQYLEVGKFELPAGFRDEYSFRLGYSYFMERDYRNAYSNLHQISGGEYEPHAKYYLAYINYIQGNYAAAKTGFTELSGNEVYAPIIPFYILQLDFLEGNYDYVTANGDRLMESAGGERRTEISRITGESWFHKKDYGKTLRYMDIYRRSGGSMGREENYLVGYSHYMQNDISEAVSALSKVVGPDDKLTQNAAYHLGGAYLRLGDKRDAMRSFSMASEAGFDAAIREDALFNYGKLQFELGGGVFNEAINVLTRYIDEYGELRRADEAREYLAAAYYNSRNYDAAYDAIIQIPDPDNQIRTALQKITYFRALENYSRGNMDEAYSLLDESLRYRYNPKYTALSIFWQGEILYRKGDHSRAVPKFKEYITLSPVTENEHKMAQYNLGYSYFNQKQWGEASTWFDRFIKDYSRRDSYRADGFNRLGDIQFARREFARAAESYRSAVDIGTPEMYYAQFQRAVAIGLSGSVDSKIAELNRIIDRNEGPFVGDAMYELGLTYLGRDRFRDAAAAMKNFTDRYPSHDKYLSALSDLGLIYQNLGDNTTALRYYKMVVDRAPGSRQAQAAMISVRSLYVDMNDVEGYFTFAAASGVETDLSTVTRDSLSYASAERLYLSTSKTAAIPAFRDYLDKYPRGLYRANALYYVADAYSAENRDEEAAAALGELSAMHYNSFTVRGLERLAPMLYDMRRYDQAADAYYKLATTAVNPQTVSASYSRYLESMKQTGDTGRLMEAADRVAEIPGLSADVKKEAMFLKAEALETGGSLSEAMTIYRDLATESQTYPGAASMLRVIEYNFANGNLEAAENMVMQMARENTPHNYLLGRAFLVLGDIYARKGDTFQARATLQSIVDGYSPADDGIVAGARERIAKL